MEKWVDIKGYEGLYQVSNFGRVKSLGRWKQNHGKKQYISEKIKAQRIDPQGYSMVDLYKDNKSKARRIHRLVAENFIENPFNKETVNHKNGDKRDNTVNNLEWATQKEQNEHIYRIGLKRKQSIEIAIKAMNKKNSKPLIDVISGKSYKSIQEVISDLNISPKKVKRDKFRFIFI